MWPRAPERHGKPRVRTFYKRPIAIRPVRDRRVAGKRRGENANPHRRRRRLSRLRRRTSGRPAVSTRARSTPRVKLSEPPIVSTVFRGIVRVRAVTTVMTRAQWRMTPDREDYPQTRRNTQS